LPDASRRAGSNPKNMLVTTDSARANSVIGASIPILDCKGMCEALWRPIGSSLKRVNGSFSGLYATPEAFDRESASFA
jgi:hypothetical protein